MGLLLAMLLSGGFTPGAGSSSGGGYTTVQEDGTPLAARTTINFTGAAITCSDSGGVTVCAVTSGGGSGNAVEVTVTMPGDGSGWAQSVVTGEAWVTATSKILCQPFNDGGDTNNTDEVYSVAQFSEMVSTRVVGTGFTLTVNSPNGPSGVFKFHCLGV